MLFLMAQAYLTCAKDSRVEDICCTPGEECCGPVCCGPDQACCHGTCALKGACCFPSTGSCAEKTRLCCETQDGAYLGDGTTCTPPDICMNRCDNCHDISRTFLECAHYTNDPAEPCGQDVCFRNTVMSATCDKHVGRIGPPQCNTVKLTVGALVMQQRIMIPIPGICTPTDTGPLRTWLTMMSGCGFDCIPKNVRVRCDAPVCEGDPIGDPGPRGRARACGCP